jgi:ribosomal protein L37AE/L43A
MSNWVILPKKSDDICPECGSNNTVLDTQYGYFRCQTCLHAWAVDEHDPDYDECDDELDIFNEERDCWEKINVKADEY